MVKLPVEKLKYYFMQKQASKQCLNAYFLGLDVGTTYFGLAKSRPDLHSSVVLAKHGSKPFSRRPRLRAQ